MFKALVPAAWTFSTVPKWCPLRWCLSLGNKKQSHGAKSGLYGGWGSVVILCWAKNPLTANDVWLGALSWWRNHVFAIFLMRKSSVSIRWTSIFSSPICSVINRTLKLRFLARTALTWATLLRSWIWRTPCSLLVLNALPSTLEHLVPPQDLSRRHNSIPISCPQQLQHFGTRFSEFRADLDRVTLLQTSLHFLPWQDTKTTTHFANVLTATKAWTEFRKVKLYTWAPPPPASTSTFLS